MRNTWDDGALLLLRLSNDAAMRGERDVWLSLFLAAQAAARMRSRRRGLR